MKFRLILLLVYLSICCFQPSNATAQTDKFERTKIKNHGLEILTFDSLEIKYSYFRDNDIDSAQIALKLLKHKAINSLQKAKVELHYGTYNQRINNYDSALWHYRNAKKLFEQERNFHGLIAILNNIGTLYQEKLQFDSALFFLTENLKITDSLGYEMEYSKSLLNIGLIYQNQELYNEASSYYRRSLDIKRKLQDIKGIALLYNNLAIIKYNEDSLNKAIEYFLLALCNYEEINDLRGLSRTYFNVGEIYFYDFEDITKALFYYKKAYDIEYQLMDFSGQCLSLIRVAECQVHLGNHKIAQKLLKKASNLSKNISNYDIYLESMLKMASICESSNDYRCALEAFKTAYKTNDSLAKETEKRRFLEQSKNYESALKEKENRLLEKEHRWNRFKNKYTLVVYILIIFILTSFVFMGFLIYRYRRKEKLQHRKIATIYNSYNHDSDLIIFLRDDKESDRSEILSFILRLLELMERAVNDGDIKKVKKAQSEILKRFAFLVSPKFESLLTNLDVHNQETLKQVLIELKSIIKKNIDRVNIKNHI